jgi:hypothetical protein
MYISPTMYGQTNAPEYKNRSISELSEVYTNLTDAIVSTTEAKQKFTDARNQFNTVTADEKEKLAQILPEKIDSVKLLMGVNSIASRYGIGIRKIAVADERQTTAPESQAASVANYRPVQMSFSASGNYGGFVQFLDDIERTLQIMDVVSIKFDSTTKDLVYDFQVVLRTYVLNPVTETVQAI